MPFQGGDGRPSSTWNTIHVICSPNQAFGCSLRKLELGGRVFHECQGNHGGQQIGGWPNVEKLGGHGRTHGSVRVASRETTIHARLVCIFKVAKLVIAAWHEGIRIAVGGGLWTLRFLLSGILSSKQWCSRATTRFVLPRRSSIPDSIRRATTSIDLVQFLRINRR